MAPNGFARIAAEPAFSGSLREWTLQRKRVERSLRVSRRIATETRVDVATYLRHAAGELEVTLRAELFSLLNAPTLTVPATDGDAARRLLYTWLRGRAVKAWHRLAARLERRWPVRVQTFEAVALYNPADLPPTPEGVVAWRPYTGPELDFSAMPGAEWRR